MTLKTRVLSLVLAGSMMLSVTPVSAFAAEDHTGGGISTLASQSSDPSVIDADVTGQTYDRSMLVAADNITLENCTFAAGAIVVGNNVTFKDCTVDGSSLSVMSLTHNFALAGALAGVEYTDAQIESLAKQFSKVSNRNAASLTLDDGTYSAPISAMSENCPLTIKGGTFKGSVLAVDGDVFIEGGTFNCSVASALATGQSQAKGALSVKNGVFAEKPVGASTSGTLKKLSALNTTFNGIADQVYVANSSSAPHIEMVYTPTDTAHKVVTWRVEMGGSWGFADATDNAQIPALLGAAQFTTTENNTHVSFNCISYFMTDAKLDPVLGVNETNMKFTDATEDAKASVEPENTLLGLHIKVVPKYYKVTKGVVSEDGSETYPTTTGTYQIKVTAQDKDKTAKTYFQYPGSTGPWYEADPAVELTSEAWRFTVAAGVDSTTGKPTATEDPGNWTYDETAGTSGTVTVTGELKLPSKNALTSDVKTETGSTIVSGTFAGKVENEGTIEGGTFSGEVTGSGNITGGVFLTKPESTANVAKSVTVTVTGGAAVNGQTKESDKADQSIPVTVVNGNKDQTLTLSADIAGHEVFGWRSAVENGETKLTGDATLTISTSDTQDLTVTPVVLMNKNDLTVIDGKAESKVDGVEVVSTKYYKLENGEPTGEGFDVVPEEPGTYVLCAALKKADTPSVESENGIALFTAPTASDLERVVVNNGVGYYAPELLTVGDPIPVSSPDEPVTPAEGGDGAGAAVVLGTVAAGGAAYLIGTQIWMETNLPDGVIPTNRQQLADMLWTAAGKPEPASAALYADISAEAVDSQKAARWCVEQGLVKDHGESFGPADYTFRPQVIKAWNDLQARKAQ